MKKIFFLLFSILFYCYSFAQVDTCFNRISSLTNNDEDSWPMKAVNGNYYVAYFSDSTGLPALWLTRSTDGGLTFDSTWVAFQSADSSFFPCLGQTSDGMFHMIWFRIFSPTVDVWYSRSTDLLTWTAPVNITNNNSIDWLGNLLIDNNDNLWMTFASNRTGNFDLFQIRSTDGGITWSPATQLTTDTAQDNLPMIFQRADSSFILTWQRYHDVFYNYLSNTNDIWYKTSPDGINWSGEDSITFDVSPLKTDILPSIYENPVDSEIYFTWTTDRFSPLGDNVELSLSEIQSGALGNQAHVITCTGYSARVIPSDTLGQFIVTWVADPDYNGQRDIYLRYLDKRLSTGIHAYHSKNNLQVFPNPFSNKINIENAKGAEIYELTDIFGRSIYSGKFIEQKDLSFCSNGIYFLKVAAPDGIQVFKLIKK